MNKSKAIVLLSLMAGSINAGAAGSCVVCPFGYDCSSGTPQKLTDFQEAMEGFGMTGAPGGGGGFMPPKGVYAENGWYLEAVDPTHATQSKHIKIKAGTTFVVGGAAKTFTSDTNKSLDIAAEGVDYDICISSAIDSTSAAASATGNSTGIKTVQHNTTCGDGWLKIGGFHSMPCASDDTTGLAPAHPYYNAKQGSIMPNSVWTLKHHPVSIEGGYVYDPAMGHWVMIYLATLVSSPSYYQDTLANNTIPISESRYDPITCRGQTGYCNGADYPGTYVLANTTTNGMWTTEIDTATKLVSRYNQRVANRMQFREANDLLIAGGARPLSDAQFSSAAMGSIEDTEFSIISYTAKCNSFSNPERLNISNIGALGMTGEAFQDLDVPMVVNSNSSASQDGGKGSNLFPNHRVVAGGTSNTYIAMPEASGSRYRGSISINMRDIGYAARGMSPDAWR